MKFEIKLVKEEDLTLAFLYFYTFIQLIGIALALYFWITIYGNKASGIIQMLPFLYLLIPLFLIIFSQWLSKIRIKRFKK